MEKTNSEKIRLGIFVILGTVILVIAVYLIGNKQNLFGKTFEISAVFKNVNGLQNGNNVRFSGINIGTVNDIFMINDSTIRVNMIVQDEMLAHIRRDAIATVGSDGLVGSMLINIIPGQSAAPLVADGDEIQSYSRIATDDMLSTLNVTNENAALLTADLLKITQALTDGKGTLGKLLNDTLMASDFRKTLSNLKSASSQANSSLQELTGIVRSVNVEQSMAGVLLSDTLSGDKMRSILSNLESSSTEIEKISNGLTIVVEEIKNGEGALNYLTTDSDFVHQLDATMKSIDEGTTRFNESMEALKHNFLFRGYFKRQERKAAKEKDKMKK